jgi:biopolymer transport protein ExbB/TolQ
MSFWLVFMGRWVEVEDATAYGLIMAIPALVMFAILQNRATSLSEDLNQTSLMVYNWLTYSYEPVTKRYKETAKALNN